MPDTIRTPRFQRGDQVRYMGSQHRYQGWLFRVVTARAFTDRESRYSLCDDTWGIRISHVRESSLRGPDDD